MANGELTYDDFLQRLDIQDILMDAGYHLNKLALSVLYPHGQQRHTHPW